ncbi:MAG: chromosome segregation protein SMC, partial [Pseudobdellovibrionaceae bacterium]
MRIKKLELVGFKSFKDRTVIHFDAGITGIVGPNGCGKSNIVDALVWVMGEMSAKHLRGSSMEDVIFAGAEGYAPAGLAEVSLTLENDGGPFPVKYIRHSEIMVTRRLHRSGDSEYFINKEPARLRDVQEIFMDTGAGAKGFSIIQQGMIGQLITAKPMDRRMLIEEAAGITKFKVRKRESQRKLEATEQNLIRLHDITGELKRQIDSLQRQAQRAERYRNIKKQIEDLDLWVSTKQYEELKRSSDEAEHTFNSAQTQEVEGETEVASLQAQTEREKLDLMEREKSLNELQQAQFDFQTRIQKREMEIQELKFEIEQAKRNEQMTGSLAQESQARLVLLQRELQGLNERHESARNEAQSLKASFELKNETFQTSSARISEVDEELTTKRRELFAVGQLESSLDAKVHSLNSQIDEIRERETHQNEISAELKAKQVEFEERRNKIFSDLEKDRQLSLDLANDAESFEANKKILTQSMAEKRTETEKFKDQLNEVTGKLYGLENLQSNFEGFEEGVKNVMFWQKSRSEMTVDGSLTFQPVAEVVEVPNEYEVAMEAALGSRLQMLLSANSEAPVEAVSYLKSEGRGRSSFFANEFSSSNERAETPEGEGVKAILKDIVNAPDRFKDSVAYLLSGVAVVDSIRTALSMRARYPGWTFVTQDGDTLSADGVLTGGASDAADSGVLKRKREIKELSLQKSEWSGKLALAQ